MIAADSATFVSSAGNVQTEIRTTSLRIGTSALMPKSTVNYRAAWSFRRTQVECDRVTIRNAQDQSEPKRQVESVATARSLPLPVL